LKALNHLLDVNVWIALLLEAHPHHSLVVQKWDRLIEGDVAFCRVTQMGLLRLLCNRNVMGKQVHTMKEAWHCYDLLLQQPKIIFCDEPLEMEKVWRQLSSNQHSLPNLWTDNYLAAFAMTAQLQLITLDRAFKKISGLDCWILS